MKFVALGRTRMLYDSVVRLIQQGHELELVITSKESPEYDINAEDFKILAIKHNAKYLYTTKITSEEALSAIQSTSKEVGVSVNWNSLVPSSVFNLFRHGVINAHAGDLPRYRGNACPNWAIIHGEKRIGVSLHKMDVGLDSGDILLKRFYELSSDTYIADVYKFLDESIPEMYLEVINGLETDSIKATPQPTDPSLSLRCFPRIPSDSMIDWNQSAEQILRLVRASSEPLPGAYTFMGASKLTVWRASTSRLAYPYLGVPGQVTSISSNSGEVEVLTGDGTLILQKASLDENQVQAPSELIRSTRTRFGKT